MSWSTAEVIGNNNIARYKLKQFENTTRSSLFKYLNDFLNALSIILANKNCLADFFLTLLNASHCHYFILYSIKLAVMKFSFQW